MRISLNQFFGWNGPATHRQFLLWQMWRVRQWNEPSLTDHYIMQLTLAVRQILAKNPRRIRLEHQRLRFRAGGAPRLSREEATRRSKGMWLGLFAAMGTRVRTANPDGTFSYLSPAEMIGVSPDSPYYEFYRNIAGSGQREGEYRGEEMEGWEKGGEEGAERREERPAAKRETKRDRWGRREEDLPEDPSWSGDPNERRKRRRTDSDEDERTMFSPPGKR